MSTTTNFKRIALVAVAALGLGVLSSVPSQATINADTLTLSSATASQSTSETYTATSAVATASFFGSQGDSISVTAALVSAPAGNTALPVIRVVDTSGATVDSNVATVAPVGTGKVANSASVIWQSTNTSAATVKYAVYLATTNANDGSLGGMRVAPATAGTYVVKLTPAAIGAGALVGSSAVTLTITVTTSPALDTNASATNSTVYIQSTNTDASLAAQDSTVVALKTASTTVAGNVYVTAKNAAGVSPANIESVTATITGAGTLGISTNAPSSTGTVSGRSLNIKPNSDRLLVFGDGTSGKGTITFTGTTSGTLLGTKVVTFSGTVATQFSAATIAATDSSVISTTGSTTVYVTPKDADGNLVTGLTGAVDFWAYSSDTSVATVGTPSYVSSTLGYSVVVSGKAVGTANISFGNASTLAAATAKSATVAVRVGSGTASNVSVTTDKKAYLPGEKIVLTVTILDSTGKPVVGKNNYTNIFSSTGITASLALQSGTLPSGTDVAEYSNTTNTKTYTLYAPVVPGTEVFSWTGGTALATANQVAGSTTVTITDNASAALAAVTALATTVASLKTLIVTLTNLVLKIQKKVKA
jgi:hypothetical protein